VIARQGTFDYVGTVAEAGTLPWTIEVKIAADRRNPADPILAGPRAWFRVEEGGPTPNPGYERATWRPHVSRARLRLYAGRWSLTASAVDEFYVDKGLFRPLQAGDVLHFPRTGCGGVGLSALRNGQLVYAVGVITSVPLGDGNSARRPMDLVAEAEAAFQRRDASYGLPELPVELCLAGHTLLLPSGGFGGPPAEVSTLYSVTVFRGFRPGIPGTDESAAVSRKGLCGDTAPTASAQLLAADSVATTS
jgi:hypothetical protein